MSEASIAKNGTPEPVYPKKTEKIPNLIPDFVADKQLAKTLARSSDPITSKLAAARVREFAGNHCDIIHATLMQWGPMTVDQIAERSPLKSQQINKRLDEMRREGRVNTTGKLALSDAGRKQRVWRAL